MIAVVDFGSQYTQLIARRFREIGVYSEIYSPNVKYSFLKEKEVKGIVLSGGPNSVYDSDLEIDYEIFKGDIPILGICFGFQFMAKFLGGEVRKGEKGEFGLTEIKIVRDSLLFEGLEKKEKVWMSHYDVVTKLPEDFVDIAISENGFLAAAQSLKKPFFAVQFHPEVSHTEKGRLIIENFAFKICKAEKNWNLDRFVEEKIEEIREQVGENKVLLAVSGGVDSTTLAVLLQRAIGDKLTAIFVDHGLLRIGEKEEVSRFLKDLGVNLVVIDARERFLEKLRGVIDPEEKRRVIGHEFVGVFKEEARKRGPFKFLAQGTLYPDVIESAASNTGMAAKIKTHHNVGGLPEELGFELIEPFRYLFKDEVRKIAEILGIPKDIIRRQPFPGPGLAVRILGEVTEDKLELLRRADRILMEEIKKWDKYDEIWQSFAVLLPIKTVGVKGDFRSYEYVIAIRIVKSEDGMTANFVEVPYDILGKIARRITNEIIGINRVVYDLTDKPPATIEWE
ncbi:MULTISPECIES: glutamine-hydrolyzing GMP synthase [Dictyoglomus]|uniref:GMP synthase [glutamine-hydrolyzing] n=1 Tax=Dictyoglomus turgidum (strain DSM 6724 / Z-1310) TaxID=515635 RepID=B8E2H3_DICTD|nr:MULTISPECIES: glutamine-hydrolyzing GMP synthase [Dictyoglomus]ACK42817.1 GMP synthase, large subunit [Dictyoglomus turgidum DSM 6724]HBU30876.1 glutamine-hydrolyzing GMP synthase [Dictyoglomus sp.]